MHVDEVAKRVSRVRLQIRWSREETRSASAQQARHPGELLRNEVARAAAETRAGWVEAPRGDNKVPALQKFIEIVRQQCAGITRH
jgi:hypothetical protein